MPQRLVGERDPSILRSGDHMTRAEFHRLYSRMPEDYRAELIGGIVFEPSPLGWPHGKHHVRLSSLFDSYCMSTPGVEAGDNATVMLSKDDEVQPDVVLRTVEERGGRSRLTRRRFVKGAPELVAEVAYSSKAIDLHLKKDRYALAGVLEYIVLCLKPKRLYWFDLKNGFELTAGNDGVFKSIVFPGLWIHGEGLLNLEHKLTDRALKQGLRSAEHKQFVASLQKRS
ncbi:MAG TPA: Uma2 family endonuclease [Candidatus Obscuribacterales bacterium]